jgi:hypothetical protein
VPPLLTGTALVKLLGFKKYELSYVSNVPASITPAFTYACPAVKLSPVPTANCVKFKLTAPSVEYPPLPPVLSIFVISKVISP